MGPIWKRLGKEDTTIWFENQLNVFKYDVSKFLIPGYDQRGSCLFLRHERRRYFWL
jgi:hypothetical protein